MTLDQTQELLLRGADIVKVGIRPGSVCTTRIKTVGYPLVLLWNVLIPTRPHGHVIADGDAVPMWLRHLLAGLIPRQAALLTQRRCGGHYPPSNRRVT